MGDLGQIDEPFDQRSLTRIAEARRELALAERALRDPSGFTQAVRAVAAGWESLGAERDVDVDREGQPGPAPSGFEPGAWRESLARRRDLSHLDPQRANSDSASLLALRDQVDLLSRAIADRERSHRAGLPWGARLRRPSLPAVLGGCAVAALLLTLVAAEPPTPRPWRAAYHSAPHADAESKQDVIRQHARLDFSWGQRSPVPGLRADAFAIRFDACLRVPESAKGGVEVRFQLRSDDVSRFWLDERLALELSGRRGPWQESVDVALAPGLHHLRAEYRDAKGPASVSLAIEVADEGAWRRVPGEWLSPPPEPFRAHDPCRLESGGFSG